MVRKPTADAGPQPHVLAGRSSSMPRRRRAAPGSSAPPRGGCRPPAAPRARPRPSARTGTPGRPGRPAAPRATAATTSTADDHAAVDVHLGPVRRPRATTPGSSLQRGRGSVELPAAVVGDDDRVRTGVDHRPRVLGGLHTLDHQGPCQTDRSQARSARVSGGVEHPPDQVGDGAAERLSEANSSGSVVSRSNHQAGCSAPSAMVRSDSDGRDGQAVAHVAQPRAGDGGVDGQHQGLVTGPLARATRSRLASRSRHR